MTAWLMGAMALALGVHLSKPGVYQLNPQGMAPGAPHLPQAVNLASKVIAAQVVCVLFAIFSVVLWMGTRHA